MISIILCRPQMGENIGAAARAMLNFGLSDLRIVAPRDGWPNERAIATASGAFDIIPEPKVFNTLDDAISDLHFCLATTARQRDMVKQEYTPKTASEEINTRTTQGQNIGIVFGAERTGMTNDEISLCQAILSIPSNPDFYSLNLAQAVLLVSYELSIAINEFEQPNNRDQIPATQEYLNNFMARLISDLEERNFFRSKDLKPTMMRNIQNIFTRADITEQEIRTLHGILSALRGNKSGK